ncbi:hypothetical protein [Domibacillus indicus]|uniref:hypothetical protein n=1 Tax=Domibacillus indicus TaxID=1437523 RepID=UPI00061824AF|nr:hypothetical protein [Domibacillus indicus]
MNVRALFKEAFRRQDDTLVYGLLDLLRRGVVDGKTDEKAIPFEKMDNNAIGEMKSRNALGFRPVHVYAVTSNRTLWLLIAAASKEQALQKASEHGGPPGYVARCRPDYAVERNGRAVTAEEMISECGSFPALVGVIHVNIHSI